MPETEFHSVSKVRVISNKYEAARKNVSSFNGNRKQMNYLHPQIYMLHEEKIAIKTMLLSPTIFVQLTNYDIFN